MQEYLSFNKNLFHAVISEQLVKEQFFKSVVLQWFFTFTKLLFFLFRVKLNFIHCSVCSGTNLYALSKVTSSQVFREGKYFN